MTSDCRFYSSARVCIVISSPFSKEWQLMLRSHVTEQLDNGHDFVVCPDHKTATLYGDLGKWLAPGTLAIRRLGSASGRLCRLRFGVGLGACFGVQFCTRVGTRFDRCSVRIGSVVRFCVLVSFRFRCVVRFSSRRSVRRSGSVFDVRPYFRPLENKPRSSPKPSTLHPKPETRNLKP